MDRLFPAGCREGSQVSRLLRRRGRSEEHTSELQSQSNLVCRLLLEKKKNRGALLPRPARVLLPTPPHPPAPPPTPRPNPTPLTHHPTPPAPPPFTASPPPAARPRHA